MHGVVNDQAFHEIGQLLGDPIGVQKVLVSTAVVKLRRGRSTHASWFQHIIQFERYVANDARLKLL